MKSIRRKIQAPCLKMKIKRCFTLLEMLVVMALLSVVAAVVGVQMVSSTKGEKFKAESGILLERVRLAQEMMMLGKDLTLHLTKVSEKKWTLEMVPKIYGDRIHSKLLASTNTIKGIESISYNGAERDRIELPFISKGGEMAEGELVLKTGEWEKRLILPGYPTFLTFKTLDKEPLMYQNWYPQEVMEKYAKTKVEETGNPT